MIQAQCCLVRPVAPHLVDSLITRSCPACRVPQLVVVLCYAPLPPESERTCEKPELLISVFVKNRLTDSRSEPAEVISTMVKVQVASDAQHQLLVTKFSGVPRSLKQRLLQYHEMVRASVRVSQSFSGHGALPVP